VNELMKPLILIVEDEPAQIEVLRYNLESDGFRTSVATDGQEGLLRAEEELPDLIVLDWMLPEVSGVEVCRRLREGDKTRGLPIIMLTARGAEEDRIRGLENGADDYVVKPYSPSEMVARIRAVLRRSRPDLGSEKLEHRGISVDLETYQVTRDGTPIQLGPTEFRVLRALIERPGRVLSREQLLDKAWGRDIYVEMRTVDVHVGRLRKALNTVGTADAIRTVRSAGYALADEGP
jgi:two-component system, OmpR family, phosphate regulon response regulator PhoB